MREFLANLDTQLEDPLLRVAVILIGAIIFAVVARTMIFGFIRRLTRKTTTDIDDELIGALRNPVTISIVLGGLIWALRSIALPTTIAFALMALIQSLAVLIWVRAALRVGTIFLEAMSRNRERLNWIQPQTLPLLQIVWKVLIIGGCFYFLFVAWNINPTSWIASAGVLGIAVGFAAKDTLSNLFAGIFIVADAPYKIGDFVVIDGTLRGQITDIGVRSSRILTRDDIEVTVPNAVIANGTIINETGGPHRKMRVRTSISVAYGSDIDQVRDVLIGCSVGVPHIAADPAPRVRFREFGASGLRFELLVWTEEPVYRGRVLDELNRRVYQALNAEGIEIPYAKQDIYIKELPR